MKKLLKILTMVAAVLTTAVLFTTCKQFLDDPEEFLGYWSSEVVPIDFSINKPYQMSNDGALCIPSAYDVTLKIKLRNPRNFTLIMPTSVLDAGKVINFPGFPSDQQPGYNTDYTFKQTGDMLELTYKEAFLKAHEWSNGGIGPEITLISTDGRKFSKKFSLNIEANTPPPEISDITIARNGEHYVLCFKVQDTDMGTIITGGNLHKDLGLVITKEGEEPKKIPLPIVSSGFAVNPADGLLLSASPIIAPVPSGTWKVYFKTATKLTESTLPTKYTVRLTDKKGLSSAPKEAKTLGCIPDLTGPGTAWKNLKQAVEGAQEGGVITVMGNVKATNAPGNNGAISVRKKKITIRKGGGITCELNANKNTGSKPEHRIFTVENGGELTLENITLTDGMATGTPTAPLEEKCGGGIFVKERGKAKLKNCTIKNCKADKFGGGICSEGELTLDGGTIGGSSTNANEAQYGGAICVHGKGSVKMESGSLMANKVSALGGGVYIKSGTFTMTGGEIKTNNAKNGGGVALDEGGTLKLSGSGKIINNTAENNGNGGGICVGTDKDADENTGTLKMTGGEISGNTANGGGGIAVLHGTFTMSDGKVIGNTATTKGGGIFGFSLSMAKGEITVSGGEISGNTAKASGVNAGGGICSLYKLTVSGGAIKENKATAGFGGGIGVEDSIFYFLGGTVSGNMTESSVPASALGKGIFVASSVTMTMSGSAKVDTDNNDVYLGNYGTTKAFITVTGSLTNKPAARLTMANDVTGYQIDRVVVKGGDGYSLTNEDKEKFPITKQTSPPQDWETKLDVANNCLKLKKN